MEVLELVKKAKDSTQEIVGASTVLKNKILKDMVSLLEQNASLIISENKKDMDDAKDLSSFMKERLLIDEKRLRGMCKSIIEVADLKDPVGEVLSMEKRPSGIQIGQMRVPIGVICVIYESRPNVTSDIGSLCIKSGNACILKGGKESVNSNRVIVKLMKKALKDNGINEDVITFIDTKGRHEVLELLKMNKYIDMIVPRGGEELIKVVTENSSIPVVKHDKGVCHLFIDYNADRKMTEEIALNAKTQRPSVCNSIEKILIHKNYENKTQLLEVLSQHNVEIRGDEAICRLWKKCKPASEDDWYKEYLDMIVTVGIVDSVDDAIFHINKFGSHHSEAIITNDYTNAQKFLKETDSAAVYVNASTRFTDGGEFGMGAEVGISTQKLHARGPMGLKELTSLKYIIYGSGQIRK